MSVLMKNTNRLTPRLHAQRADRFKFHRVIKALREIEEKEQNITKLLDEDDLKVKEETESKMRSEITTLEKELEKEITDLNNLNDLAQKKSNTEIVSLNEQIKTLEDQIVKINQKEEQYKQQIKKYEE